MFLDLGHQIIIIEIDENKHINYNYICENKRLMEISQDVGHRPIVFIRFNPDNYLDNDGNVVKSCWTTNKLGIYILNKYQLNNWNMRLDTLKNTINYWTVTQTDKTIEIIHLYYETNK